jgi:Flp pilus assembly protein TadG
MNCDPLVLPKIAGRFLLRFVRDRRGSAVEYAFIGAPFMALVFGVLELGMLFMAQTTLDNATQAAARRVRTGELQIANGNAATFKSAVCANMTWMSTSCSANLVVDVRNYTNFSSVTTPSPVVNGAVDPTATTYSPGVAGSVVLVRCFYTWTLITPTMNAALQTLSNGKRLMTSAVAFRNEPY